LGGGGIGVRSLAIPWGGPAVGGGLFPGCPKKGDVTAAGPPKAGLTRLVGGFDAMLSGKSFQFEPSMIRDDGGGATAFGGGMPVCGVANGCIVGW